MRIGSTILFCLALAAMAAAFGCQGQGEGQVCDPDAGNAGNDDCQAPLTCQPISGVGSSQGTNRCCPPDRTTAKTQICSLPSSPVNPNPEGGATPDASGDGPAVSAADVATTETSNDAVSDSTAEAGPDGTDGATE